MPQFMFAYHGGKPPSSPAEIETVMAEWSEWFEGMGTAVVTPGNPVGASATVFRDRVEDNGGANPVSGYSVVSARDVAAAVEMAKRCPMVRDGSGSVEVAEIHEM